MTNQPNSKSQLILENCFLIQPRDVCPSDYLTYVEDKLYSREQERIEKALNLKNLIEKAKRIQKLRHTAVENLKKITQKLNSIDSFRNSRVDNYNGILDKYSDLTNQISQLCKNVGTTKTLIKTHQTRNKLIDSMIDNIQEYQNQSFDNSILSPEYLEIKEKNKKLFRIEGDTYQGISDEYNEGIKKQLNQIKEQNQRVSNRMKAIKQKQMLDSLKRLKLLNL